MHFPNTQNEKWPTGASSHGKAISLEADKQLWDRNQNGFPADTVEELVGSNRCQFQSGEWVHWCKATLTVWNNPSEQHIIDANFFLSFLSFFPISVLALSAILPMESNWKWQHTSNSFRQCWVCCCPGEECSQYWPVPFPASWIKGSGSGEEKEGLKPSLLRADKEIRALWKDAGPNIPASETPVWKGHCGPGTHPAFPEHLTT